MALKIVEYLQLSKKGALLFLYFQMRMSVWLRMVYVPRNVTILRAAFIAAVLTDTRSTEMLKHVMVRNILLGRGAIPSCNWAFLKPVDCKSEAHFACRLYEAKKKSDQERVFSSCKL